MTESGHEIETEEHVEEFPEYLALFATSYRRTHAIFRKMIHEILCEVLNYSLQKFKQIHQTSEQSSQDHLRQIEQDILDFQNFKAPPDNYHLTCLYIGKNKTQLEQEHSGYYKVWNQGVRLNIRPSFIVYIPNYLMAAYCPQVGNVRVQNTYPHITLALKGGATAVQSNFVLEALMIQHPQVFGDMADVFTEVQVQYNQIKRCAFVINHQFKVEMEASNSKVMSKIVI